MKPLLLLALAVLGVTSLRADPVPGLKEPLKTVTEQYLIIEKKLSADSFEGVAAAAAGMKAAMAKPVPAGTPASLPFAPDFLIAVDTLAEAKDLHETRVAFSDVSNCLIAALARNGAKTGTLHTAFCSMRKAYWVQTDAKKIENPYYGSAMPDCGEFQKEY